MEQFKYHFENEVKTTNLVVIPTWEECQEWLEPFAYDFEDADYTNEIKESITSFVEGFTKDGIEKKMFEEYRAKVGCSKNDVDNCIFFVGTKEELLEDMELWEDVPEDKEGFFDEAYDEVSYGFIERIL